MSAYYGKDGLVNGHHYLKHTYVHSCTVRTSAYLIDWAMKKPASRNIMHANSIRLTDLAAVYTYIPCGHREPHLQPSSALPHKLYAFCPESFLNKSIRDKKKTMVDLQFAQRDTWGLIT